jgi:hypothetical protein
MKTKDELQASTEERETLMQRKLKIKKNKDEKKHTKR